MSNKHEAGAHNGSNEARARFETLLRDQFKVQAAFVPVRVVARVLGFAPSTLNAYVREGKFFMPVSRQSRIPMVAVEDLVDWYCRREWEAPMESSEPPQRRAPAKPRARRRSAARRGMISS